MPINPEAASPAGASPPAAASRDELVELLASIVGAGHVLSDPDVTAGFTTDWTGRFAGPAQAVVRPASAEQVAQVVTACAEAGVAVVVQGGNTGLVGGSVPPAAPGSPAGRLSAAAAGSSEPGTSPPWRPLPVVVNTARLADIGPVDVVAGQVTAGAGATLADVQAAAAAAGFLFPVDLAARASATVGGMVATNAGGLHVLRYGSMRRQVLGLQVVLADGRTLTRLSGLVKDNTGYDLSQLMVGSEGTLGIVTAVRLRLVAPQPQRAVALFGLDSTAAAVDLATKLRREAEGLTAAEIFYQAGLELVCRHGSMEPPFSARPVYLLVEVAGRHDVVGQLAAVLAGGEVDDEATAVADDDNGARRLWAYRERHTEAISSLGVPHKLDVTLPLAALAVFEEQVRAVVAGACPDAITVLFGHVGDGNLHVNVVGPAPDDDTVDEAVLKLVAGCGGSISAEHGIGRAKVQWLGLTRSSAELAAMRAVKDALDPTGLLNPGVLFAVDGASTS